MRTTLTIGNGERSGGPASDGGTAQENPGVVIATAFYEALP